MTGAKIFANRYCPTWGPDPTRSELWAWRLWRRWLGKPRPVKERVIYNVDGTIVVSPENLAWITAKLAEPRREDHP